jgi:hypothetical protein
MAWKLTNVRLSNDPAEELVRLDLEFATDDAASFRTLSLRPEAVTEAKIDAIAAETVAFRNRVDAARAVVSAKSAKVVAALPVKEVKLDA